MKTIAIVNQKGGVGKTVTTVNIAVGLAKQGKKVLAIDLDPQGSMSISLGEDEPDRIVDTISNILENIKNNISFDTSFAIKNHTENIDFIASNIQLAGIEAQLINNICRELMLSKYIDMISGKYDVVIIDCSPSLGMLTINALACADEVIIPVQANYLSVKGMEQLFNTIGLIKNQINSNLNVAGILITMVDSRTKYAKDIIKFIRKTYVDKINIFKTIIPMSVKASEMSVEGKSIYEYDPKGKVAVAYTDVINEILEISVSEVI